MVAIGTSRLSRSSHRSRKHDTSRAPCHRPATVPMRLWRNSSLYREEQSRSPAARCDVRQARRVPTQSAPAALLPTKNQPESSTKTNRCSQPRQALLGFTQSHGIAGKRTGNFAKSPLPAQQRLQIVAPLLGFRLKFPTQRNREFFRWNREFLLRNREFCQPKSKSSPDEVFGTHKGLRPVTYLRSASRVHGRQNSGCAGVVASGESRRGRHQAKTAETIHQCGSGSHGGDRSFSLARGYNR